MNNPTIDGTEDEHLHMGMAAVADALHHARIEVEGYRKDAERYRWLRGRISGAEYRRLGLDYGEISDVDGLIDKALIDTAKAE